jgi:hypothetical protein
LNSPFSDWLAKLDKVTGFAPIPNFTPDILEEFAGRLTITPADSAEILRTMPAPDHPETWSMLERSRHLLTQGLANRANNAQPLPPMPPALRLFPVHLILVSIDAIRECHHDFGIPDDISWQTLSHIGRAMAAYRVTHGEAGIQLTRWDWLRYIGWLYEVGRLTVIPYRLRAHPEAGPLFWYDDTAAVALGPGFRKGDPALSLHIPPAEPLTPEACDESLRRMSTAFAKVYADAQPRIATCTSWLLDEQLTEYLPADSNIIAFQKRFELVPGARDDDDAFLLFVFGPDRPKDLDALPQRTTLERAAVRHLRQGRHWRMRTGWLRL